MKAKKIAVGAICCAISTLSLWLMQYTFYVVLPLSLLCCCCVAVPVFLDDGVGYSLLVAIASATLGAILSSSNLTYLVANVIFCMPVAVIKAKCGTKRLLYWVVAFLLSQLTAFAVVEVAKIFLPEVSASLQEKGLFFLFYLCFAIAVWPFDRLLGYCFKTVDSVLKKAKLK